MIIFVLGTNDIEPVLRTMYEQGFRSGDYYTLSVLPNFPIQLNTDEKIDSILEDSFVMRLPSWKDDLG
jgi:hypothetical protein